MADQVYAADVLYPEYRDGDDVKRYVQQVSDYLFLLREGLGYTLDNLSMRNFNQTALVQMADMIREPVMIQLTDQAGKLTQLSVDLDGVAARVTDTEGGISELRIEAGRISSEVSDLSGNYTTLSQTVGGLSTSVTTINNNYISRSSATQTASGFVLEVKDGNNTTATKMDRNGLTVYNGNITIKDGNGRDALRADTYGNMALTGAILGSVICSIDHIPTGSSSTERYIYMDDIYLKSMKGLSSDGFVFFAGDANQAPYIGLQTSAGLWRTVYNANANIVTSGFSGGNAYFGYSANNVGMAYSTQNYISVDQTGAYFVGKTAYDAITQRYEPDKYIKANGNAIDLVGGEINLTGKVYINGTLLPY